MRYAPFDVSGTGEGCVPGWVETLEARPTIYATLGTVNNRTPGLATAILAVLRDEPINLILTIGPNADPAEFGEQPPHVRVEEYVPQSVLMPSCDLVVCHGGFGTMLTALDAGLPLVIIPIAADQPDNARRCADLGVAEVISPEQRTAQVIQTAVREVLREPRYRRNAEQLRAEMRAAPDLADAVELLEQLARERRPLVAG
jgi:MGT family glycosyltransferase